MKYNIRKTLKVLVTSNYWSFCQNSCFWNMFWKEDYVVRTSNICTLAIHFWYINNAFSEFCQQILEKNISHFSGWMLPLEFKVLFRIGFM